MVFEEIAGTVEVRISRDQAGEVTQVTIAAPQPLSLGTTVPAEVIAACAGISAADVRTAAHAPIVASMGTPFVVAEVTGDALTSVRPDVAAFQAALADQPALQGQLGLHLYAHDGPRLRARMFAPLAGVPEDPATGSANVALAGLLLSLRGAQEARYDVVQGVEMGHPSLLQTEAHRVPDGIRATVGGRCVPVLRGAATR